MNGRIDWSMKYLAIVDENLNHAMNYLEAVEPDLLDLDPKAVDAVLMCIEDLISAVRDIHNSASKNLDASSRGETA